MVSIKYDVNNIIVTIEQHVHEQDVAITTGRFGPRSNTTGRSSI